MFSPWRKAIEAERRATAAEERAAFLEQELNWMRQQVEKSSEAAERANKIVANVFAQAHGFVPFPEASHAPEPKQQPLADDFFDTPLERPRDAAIGAFVESERQFFETHKNGK